MSPDLPVLTVVFLIISWTTCGALAILLSYLYYVFKVCGLVKPRLCVRHLENASQALVLQGIQQATGCVHGALIMWYTVNTTLDNGFYWLFKH